MFIYYLLLFIYSINIYYLLILFNKFYFFVYQFTVLYLIFRFKTIAIVTIGTVFIDTYAANFSSVQADKCFHGRF